MEITKTHTAKQQGGQPDYDAIWAEHRRRQRKLDLRRKPDPVTGRYCLGTRRKVATPVEGLPEALVPVTMLNDEAYARARNNDVLWRKLRLRHDFEYWCHTCVRITDKRTGERIPLVLNEPQRRVAVTLENDRLAGRPMRLILLKARQWGGSTLIQTYMAWIQCVHKTNWNSVIMAHFKDAATTIRGMFTEILDGYPEELWEGDGEPKFRPYEGSVNVRRLDGRGCRVTVASADNYDAIRGSNYAMAHLSETAFWRLSQRHDPQDLVRAVTGAILPEPMTLIAMESTANGTGNYFHAEWLRCAAGKGDKRAIFVAWYEIATYRSAVTRAELPELWESLTGYERGLWEKGLTLQMIKWYHIKALEYQQAERMQAEYPTTPAEAFMNTGNGVFGIEQVEELRKGCTEAAETGEISADFRFTADSKGCLRIWERPDEDDYYVVAVDIGGRSSGADWSVIAVLAYGGGQPRVVAQWRGHTDHDMLADKAMRIARYYRYALLVVESNTLETEGGYAAGSDNLFVLERMARTYPYMYCRRVYDSVAGKSSSRIGFHTNRATKPMLVNTLIEHVREGGYCERDHGACDEMSVYVQYPNGSYGARPGCHDDILMTRALALRVMQERAAPALPGRRMPDVPDW